MTYRDDALNRLSSISDDGDTTFTGYGYDPVGDRASTTYPNRLSRFQDGGNLLSWELDTRRLSRP